MPVVSEPDSPFRLGHADVLREGGDVAIIAAGSTVSRAMEAADQLRLDGIEARVLNMASISPIDHDAVRVAADTGGIVTAEEATVTGGLGSAVASLVVQSRPVPMRILGIPWAFAPTGSAGFLLEHFGLTADRIAQETRDVIAERRG